MLQSIVIRDIDSIDDIHRAEDLQREVWGLPDIEIVPATQMIAAKTAGGILLGAFDGDVLVGFAYGFAAIEHGRLTHHSHMVGVRREYRYHDLGFRLKTTQRERVLGQGIETMSWTFDPLQSINAYFNFSKLGVIAAEYFVDLYGSETASFLHRNGTDRLWVTWELNSEAVVNRIRGGYLAPIPDDLAMLIKIDKDGRPIYRGLDEAYRGEDAAIEIPGDISAFESKNLDAAREWRAATRKAFMSSIDNGYFVTDFYRVERYGKDAGVYRLSKK